MKKFYTTTKKIALAIACLNFAAANAQEINIGAGSSMVLNGNVSLVVNNAALKNNGTFSAGKSTVNFTGVQDSSVSYVDGSSRTVFYNMTVAKSSKTVALKSNVAVRSTLTVSSGNLYTGNKLTLISDSFLTARVAYVPAGSTITGKTNVERYVPLKRAWRLMTAPVTGSNTIYESWQNNGVYTPGIGTLVTGPGPSAANGLDVSAQNTTSMKTWNATTQALVAVSNTKKPISAGTAGKADNTPYFMFVRGDRDPANTNTSNWNTTTLTATGTLQTGTQTFTASSKMGAYTLIGNPYASSVDFNKLTTTNVIKRMYVWDPSVNGLGAYIMLDDLTGTGNYIKSLLSSLMSNEIQSGQAFFVQTLLPGPASVTFTESSKISGSSNQGFRPEGTTSGIVNGSIRTTLSLLNNDSSLVNVDGSIAEFNNDFTSDVDWRDALKFGNTGENLSIVRNNTTLTAERRPAANFDDTVYFRITKSTARAYRLTFDLSGFENEGMDAILVDSYLGTNTLLNISGKTEINFASNASTAAAQTDRFKIVFQPSMNLVVLPVTLKSVAAYQKGNNIAVEWKVENEINMAKYDVEKSTDGTSFTKANTTAVAGNNNASNAYSWLDANAAKGYNYYRIKTYDKNGKTAYSAIVKVNMDKVATGSFTIYPNPVTTNTINLMMNNKPAGKYNVTVTSANGQKVYTQSVQNAGGNSSQSLNTGSKLPAGVYQMEIVDEANNHSVEKLIVQ